MMQSVMQEETAQKKGLVVVHSFVGRTKENGSGFNVVKSVFQIRLAVPHRLSALHLCYVSDTTSCVCVAMLA